MILVQVASPGKGIERRQQMRRGDPGVYERFKGFGGMCAKGVLGPGLGRWRRGVEGGSQEDLLCLFAEFMFS